MTDNWIFAIGNVPTALNAKVEGLSVTFDNPNYIIEFPDGFVMQGGDRTSSATKVHALNLTDHIYIAVNYQTPTLYNYNGFYTIAYQTGDTSHVWKTNNDDNLISNTIPTYLGGADGQTPDDIMLMPLAFRDKGVQIGDIYWNYVRQFKAGDLVVSSDGTRYRALGQTFLAKITE